MAWDLHILKICCVRIVLVSTSGLLQKVFSKSTVLNSLHMDIVLSMSWHQTIGMLFLWSFVLNRNYLPLKRSLKPTFLRCSSQTPSSMCSNVITTGSRIAMTVYLWTLRLRTYCVEKAHYKCIIKDTDYIGIFIVFVDSVLSLLLLLLLWILDTFFGTYLLRDYRTHGSQILQYETTYPRDGLPVFRLSIQTPVLDLQANPDFHVLIHISRTSCPIDTCDTSTCRS